MLKFTRQDQNPGPVLPPEAKGDREACFLPKCRSHSLLEFRPVSTRVHLSPRLQGDFPSAPVADPWPPGNRAADGGVRAGMAASLRTERLLWGLNARDLNVATALWGSLLI